MNGMVTLDLFEKTLREPGILLHEHVVTVYLHSAETAFHFAQTWVKEKPKGERKAALSESGSGGIKATVTTEV